jgi:hypothetical protein
MDEPPVAIANLEMLFNSYRGSFQFYDGVEPECLDFSDPAVRGDIASDVLLNTASGWDSTNPAATVATSMRTGASEFNKWLATARDEIRDFASSSTPKSANFETYYPDLDNALRALVGDSETNPGAYLEFRMHLEAEECSQEGYVRLDTRNGQIVILRAHGC